MELDYDYGTATVGSLKKKYYYSPNSQILAQDIANGPSNFDRYFYLHDRLGSVRLVIDKDGLIKNYYTYSPFGDELLYSNLPSSPSEWSETVDNPWKFTGQWFDAEIDQYYLRARQYDPYLARFTTRDPIKGSPNEPMSLHAYLYCLNEPVNRKDLSGKAYVDINVTWTYGNVAGLINGGVFGSGGGPLGIAVGASVGFIVGGFGATGGVMIESNEAHLYLGLSYGFNPAGGFDFTTSIAPDPAASVESGWHMGFAGTFAGGYTQWSENLTQGGASIEVGMTTGASMNFGGNASYFYVFSSMNEPDLQGRDPRSLYSNLGLLDKAVMMNEMREDAGATMGGKTLGITGSIGLISMYGVTSNMLLGM